MNKPSKAPIKSPKLPPRQSQSGKEETKRTNSSNSSHRPSISIVFHPIAIYFMIYIRVPFWSSLYQLKPWPWEAITRVCFRSMKPRSTSKSNRISRTSRPSWHCFVHGWSTGKYRLRLLWSVDVSSFAMHILPMHICTPFCWVAVFTPEKAGRPSGVQGHNQTSSLLCCVSQAEEPYDEVTRSPGSVSGLFRECPSVGPSVGSNCMWQWLKQVETCWNKIPTVSQGRPSLQFSPDTVVACYNDGILSLAISKSIRLCSALKQVFEDLLVADGAKLGLISCDWSHWSCLRIRQMISHSWTRLPEPAKPQSHACDPDTECDQAWLHVSGGFAYHNDSRDRKTRVSLTCEIYNYNVAF